jgi:hypothetical protein
MKNKLHLELTDEQAGKLIKKEIKKCLNDYYRKLTLTFYTCYAFYLTNVICCFVDRYI